MHSPAGYRGVADHSSANTVEDLETGRGSILCLRATLVGTLLLLLLVVYYLPRSAEGRRGSKRKRALQSS